jgi:MoaA/NifB/PqqE/SkfB family radical SAM enzyme
MNPAAVDRLTHLAGSERVPLYAMLELTWRCNFRCVHCFQEGQRESHDELTTAEWMRVMDELAELGCVFLVLTGGEALTRGDFADLHRHAVGRGFMVTVFTNGSLVDEPLLEVWSRVPPRKVEVTLYGMSAETYRAVTGRREGYERARWAVEQLVALGVRVELKAPAIRPLLADLHDMAEFAAAQGLSFRIDSGIFPRLDGNRAPLAYRLSPEEAVELDSSCPDFAAALDTCFARVSDFGNRVYRCGAGSYGVGVGPSGQFVPCQISPAASASWRELGTQRAWHALSPEAARTHAPQAGDCGDCAVRQGCSRCAGKSWMETGSIAQPVPHHCELTELRRRRWKESA